MVTEHTNIVYNCRTCAEPKYESSRYREWLHLRRDSLCEDDNAPVTVRLPLPVRVPA